MDYSAAAKIMMASGSLKKFEVLHVTENNYYNKAEHNKPPAWKEVDVDIPVDDFVGERNDTYKAEDYELEAWTSARAELGFTAATFTQNGSQTAPIGFSSCHIHINTESGRTFSENDTYTSTYPGGFGTYTVEVEDRADEYEAAKARRDDAVEDCNKKKAFARYIAKNSVLYHTVPEGVTYPTVARYVNNVNGGTAGHPVGKHDGVTDIDTIVDKDATYTDGDGVVHTGIYTEAWHNGTTGTVIYHAYSLTTGLNIDNPSRPDGTLAIISIPEGITRYPGSHVQVTSFSVTDRSTGEYVIHARWCNANEGDSWAESGEIVRGGRSDIFKDFGTSGHELAIRPPLDHNIRNWTPPN